MKLAPRAAATLSALLLAATAAVAADTDPASLLAQARQDPRRAQLLQRNGQRLAAFCANCHGDNGNSAKPEVPNLAGQNPAYLLEQLRLFAEGRRRDTFMEGLIKAMSSDEKVGSALYFAAQQVVPRAPADTALATRGAETYRRTCMRCHGSDGRGDEKIPRIAGQQPVYLETTLKRYRSGGAGRNNPMMSSTMQGLDDQQIAALVTHVAAMK